MPDDILKNIATIQARIKAACERSHRHPSSVKLLLATKTITPERIAIALQAGHTLIAENRIQELKEKHADLQSWPHTNHFIGHLQTNKVKDILKYDVACLQSLDRIALAQKLHERLFAAKKTLDVLIQVNTSGEASKFGIAPEEALTLTKQVAALPTLKIKGLMTIGIFSADTEKVRSCFRLLHSIKNEIAAAQIPEVSMQELSMGMSGDLEVAIEEGATIIRVGTAIFGKRDTPDSYYWNEQSDK